jgi:phosphoribosylformylglycinamidine cyclo-ligase
MSTADRYKAAGVDLDAADHAKQRIKAAVVSTHTPLTLGGFGAFGGMVRVPDDVHRPALVMSTDGVGTKVLVAIRAGKHDTVGEDLVNHSVNDILVHGARPIAFLDYIAGAAVAEETLAALVEGVARACRRHRMALVGGETAQMPDMYHEGHYDLAGTIVGVVAAESVIQSGSVRVGDVLVGYESTGLHTNGYTLARQLMFEDLRLEIGSEVPGLDVSVAEALLAVHRSYWEVLNPVLDKVHSLAHITGGGIAGNLSRSLPDGCAANVVKSTWRVPDLFRIMQEAGRVHEDEMFRVFNMGLGMIAVVSPADVEAVRAQADSAAVGNWVVGEVVRGEGVHLVD